FSVNRDLPIFQLAQTLSGGKPETPVRGREDRTADKCIQVLFRSKSSYGKLTKAVESIRGTDPDVALAVLKNSMDSIAGKAVQLSECIDLPLMYMHDTGAESSDPDVTITIAQKP